jgi:hypothetical protein
VYLDISDPPSRTGVDHVIFAPFFKPNFTFVIAGDSGELDAML